MHAGELLAVHAGESVGAAKISSSRIRRSMTVSCVALVTCVIFLEFRSAPRHTFASTAGFGPITTKFSSAENNL